jgi:hypothetical protein
MTLLSLTWRIALAGLATATLTPAELKPHTLAAFDRYVRLTEARMAPEIDGRASFLWIDRHAPADRDALFARLRRGEVVSEKLETRDNGRPIDVDDGLIHHWIGTVFLPGVTVDRARAFVEQYDRYAELFSPTIQRSRVLRRTPDRFEVAMRTWSKKVVTVVIDADYVIEYRPLSGTRLATRSVATNLFQVDNAGQPDERRTPGDRAGGYLWRLNTYCSFEQRPEGTYEQCESISLTRGIPFMLIPIVRPFVTGIPRETLEFTLGRVRDGLAGR